MIISAVIAEFNPFHDGHRYILGEMKKQSDATVAIMSTHFVQRGDCAIYPKARRVAAALAGGADLVLDLPCVYALSSARHFAEGAVRTLNACGCIDMLFFGSECGSISALTSLAQAELFQSKAYDIAVLQNLKEGVSYARARAAALGKDGELLSSPNNILATEYIRALIKTKSAIAPVTVKRRGGGYNNTDTGILLPSAAGIRNELKRTGAPNCTFIDAFDLIVAARLKTAALEELSAVPDCNRELAVRIKKAAHKNTFAEICAESSCKRYPQSRIRRIILNFALGNHFKSPPAPQYIRPCGFNEVGRHILAEMKSCASLPVAARGAELKGFDIFELECRAADIYSLVRNEEGNSELRASPIIVQNKNQTK